MTKKGARTMNADLCAHGKLIAAFAFALQLLASASALGGMPRYSREAHTWTLVDDALGASAGAPLSDGATALASPWAFAPNVRVHPVESGIHIWSDIALRPDGAVAVAWMDDHQAGYHIYYSVSTDGGATWSLPERVDDRVTGTQSKFVDFEITSGGIPVAVWEDDRSGGINVYFSKRTGGVPPWSPGMKVNSTGGSPSTSDFMNASIAAYDDRHYFVAWTDWREGPLYQVYMRATSDGGATWGTETRVSDELGYQPVANRPCLIVDRNSPPSGARLFCVTNDWRGNVPGGRYPNVYCYGSTNGGATWSVGVQVNDIEPLYQQTSSHALVLVEDGTLTSAWLNNTGGHSQFRASVSTDQGVTWAPSTRIDQQVPTGGTGTYNSIASAGGWVLASFDIYTTDWDLYFRASSDGGRTWPDSMVRVDDDATGARSSTPVLATPSPGLVYIAWEDGRPGFGVQKIYATRGTHSATGVGWGWEPGEAAAPRLAVRPNPARVGDPVRILLEEVTGGNSHETGSREGAASAIAPHVASAEVRIFNHAGQEVRILPAGDRESVWDGRAADGRLVSPGVYLARWRAGSRAAVGKIILTR